MKRALFIRNRQRTRAVNTTLLRRVIRTALVESLNIAEYNLGIYLVTAPEITRLNEEHLRHAGATDVITFDYAGASGGALHGEIFICLDLAVTQARQFRTTWQQELARYAIHGVLHLCGYDDLRAPERRRMKREENRVLRQIATALDLDGLGNKRAKATRAVRRRSARSAIKRSNPGSSPRDSALP